MTFRVIPYRAGSGGARALATALQGRVLKLEGSEYVRRYNASARIRERDTIINWGNTAAVLGIHMAQVLNGHGISDASNKLRFFQLLAGSGQAELIPNFWTDRAAIPDDAFPIVCRTVLAGHSGEGIVIANTRAEIVPAPLYVQYVKKKSEFRIHVGRTGVALGQDQVGRMSIIAEQKKSKRADVDNPNWLVRNHANGFIYQRNDIVVPDTVRDVARRALAATQLDFGAVDVIYNDRQQRAYVLEINTAPGLEGQTVTDYAEFFRELAR